MTKGAQIAMSERDKLPADEVMRQMARLAMQQALQSVALQASVMAKTLPPEITGRQALESFAAAMIETSRKTWPNEGKTT